MASIFPLRAILTNAAENKETTRPPLLVDVSLFDGMTKMKNRNLYEVLGVDPSASSEEIRRAYHMLALKHHPDRVGTKSSEHKADSEEKREFTEVVAAYDTLRDDKRRKAYDQSLMEKEAEQFVHEEISVSELEFDEQTSKYLLDCRCGSKFVWTTEEVKHLKSFYTCQGCSYRVRIVNV